VGSKHSIVLVTYGTKEILNLENVTRMLNEIEPLCLTVCEELSVRDSGIRLMTTLVLCPGRAPTTSQVGRGGTVLTQNILGFVLCSAALKSCSIYFWSQLFLHYSLSTAPSAGTEMDIIVEQTCTGKEVRGTCVFGVPLVVLLLVNMLSFPPG